MCLVGRFSAVRGRGTWPDLQMHAGNRPVFLRSDDSSCVDRYQSEVVVLLLSSSSSKYPFTAGKLSVRQISRVVEPVFRNVDINRYSSVVLDFRSIEE